MTAAAGMGRLSAKYRPAVPRPLAQGDLRSWILAPRVGAGARPLGAATGRGLGLLAPELAGALEALFALVLAQDAGFLDARLESAQQLIERLTLASFNVHAETFLVTNSELGSGSSPL